MVKRQRPAGRRLGDTMGAGGETIGRASGPATSRLEQEGGCGLVVSRRRHGGRGFGVVPHTRQREVREDAVNDRGVALPSGRPEATTVGRQRARGATTPW